MSSVVERGRLRLFVVIRILEESVLIEDGLREKLTESLILAKRNAESRLKRGIYEYFNIAYHTRLGDFGWPTTVGEYMIYVQLYMTQVPNCEFPKNEYMRTNILKRVKKSRCQPLKDFYDVFQQSTYFELCHFYWLINQKLSDGKTLQSNKLFASWVKMFGLGQGIFLNTPESLTPESLQTFIDDPYYSVPEWYIGNKDDWKCWNQFFCRQFTNSDPNGFCPALRPIDENTHHITSPADCTFMAVYNIGEKGMLTDIHGNPAIYKLKGFSPGSSVQHLLGANCRPFWKDFFGGTFIHYFLSPYDYHRFHTPVSGVIMALETINGQNYCDIEITEDGEFDAPDNAENGYEFRQERGCIILDNADLGKVACLPIGMAQVSSVHMYQDQLLYREVEKGREFGYFLFGGSDIILLISKEAGKLDIRKEEAGVPIHFLYGEKAVICHPHEN